MIKLHDLTKVYRTAELETTALNKVNLEISAGEFIAVMGPSGCGKSTLLKIMAGLMPPTTGRVVLDGRPVLGPRPDIGMMFQQATLLPWKTTIENIVLPIQIREGRAAAIERGRSRVLPRDSGGSSRGPGWIGSSISKSASQATTSVQNWF